MMPLKQLIDELRVDAGRKTLGELIQEREAAANGIEKLLHEIENSRSSNVETEARNPTDKTPVKRPVDNTRILLRLAEVSRMIGLSRSSIYAKIAEKTFPRPVRISERSVRWRSVDIEAWLKKLR